MRMFTKKMARVRDRARKVAAAFREAAGEIDREDRIPPELVDRLWSSGLMTLRVPKQFGGAEASLFEAALAVEELSRGCAAAGLLVLLETLGVAALREAATERQARDLFGKVVDQRAGLAFALSEPLSDEDPSSRVTTARKQGREHLIRGKKTFVSGAREADLVIVFAMTSPRARLKKGLSAFALPAGTAGMLPGPELSRSGLRGVPAVELVFEGARAGAAHRLGRAGQGYQIAQRALLTAAPLAAAMACGLLGEALEQALSFARKRGRTGSPLSEFQAVELALAEVSAGLDMSQAMTWAAAGALEENSAHAERLAREAKWMATEAAVNGIDAIGRLFGVEAALKGSSLDRLSRDARAAQVLLGPNHLHRIEVARKLLKTAASRKA